MSVDNPQYPIEIKESIPKHEIAFAFIKPDSLDDLPAIAEILEEHGLEIIYHDRVRLDEAAVDRIYAEVKGEHFYAAMREYLTTHDVIVLLVGGKGVEAQKVLLSLKKTEGGDGVIRQRLQKDPRIEREEVALWESGAHPRQDEVSVLLTQKNVIHTADSTEEALASLKMILGEKFEEMKRRGNLPAELWEIFSDSISD